MAVDGIPLALILGVTFEPKSGPTAVKMQIVIFVSLMFMRQGVSEQTKATPRPSLKDTTSWMENFSRQHGFLTLSTGITRINVLRVVKNCAVTVEITYPNAKTPSQPKKLTSTIFLADFDSNAVHEESDTDARTYEVNFERSDSSAVIEESVEMSDGTKTKWYVADEILYFDSEESARRFARALSHAITLCGGTPAPF